MGYYNRRWKPSRTRKREFAEKMNEVDDFCEKNHISQSGSSDSYYFSLNGKDYRVSNHSIEASNSGAYRDGQQIRPLYHDRNRKKETVYIHASKTRIMDIFKDLKNGYKLDGRGYRKD